MVIEKSQTSLEAVRELTEEHEDGMSPSDSSTITVNTSVEYDSPLEDVIIVGVRTVVKDPTTQPEPLLQPQPNRRALPQSKPKSTPKPGPYRVHKALPKQRWQPRTQPTEPKVPPPPPPPRALPLEIHSQAETTAEKLTTWSFARTDPVNYSLSSSLSYGRVNFVDPRRLPFVPTLQYPRRPRSADGNRAGVFQQRYSGVYMPGLYMG